MNYFNEDQFFMVAVSLIEKKQKLLDKKMDNHDVELVLVQDLDQLLGKLEKDNPKCKGLIDLIYKTQNFLE